MNPGKLGVWCFHDLMDTKTATENAQRIERLGYTTLWHPETTGRDPFVHAAHLLANTERLQFATGIANIYHRHPGSMIQAARSVAEHSGGRFILGIGVSHAPMVQGLRGLDYGKPVSTMRTYLEGMRNSPYTAVRPAEEPPIVLAALGPRMLELAASHANGAHPYWTTPEHTEQARKIMGPDSLLCVEQKIVLETDAQRARDAGRAALGIYKALPNYRNNWKRLGFTDEDIDTDGGSDGLIDKLVAWGDEQTIRDRVEAHWAAGADHVCIQPLAPDGNMATFDWSALEALSPNA